MDKELDQHHLINRGLIHALIVTAYVVAVAALMFNSQKIFGQINGMFGMVAFLMLFVLSATIVGALMFGKPILLYLDNHKKEAVSLLLYTGGWLLLFTFVAFITIFLIY